MKKQKIPGMVYIPLLVFLSISLYQTAQGFTDLVGEKFAWGFSIGITMILFFLTHTIGTYRIQNRSIVGFLMFYVVCSLFSYAGNFNAVYTEYQKEQLYRDELSQNRVQLHELLATSDKVLDNFSPETDAKRLRVEQLARQLELQITDPARPGLGERARYLIDEIEKILGENLTEFAGSPQQLATKYSRNIQEIATRKFSAGDLGKASEVKRKNHIYAKKLDNLMKDTLSSSEQVKAVGYNVILKTIDGINTIGLKTQEFVNDEERFSYKPIVFKNQEIGKLAFSFKSAFSQHIFVALLLSIVCIFLDWAVVLYLIVRYRGDEVEPYEPMPHNQDL